MMIAKQGIIITHAIALTALLVMAMGWQAQVQKKSSQIGFINSVESSFSTPIALVPSPLVPCDNRCAETALL
jgi:hypothetical protein